MARTLLAISIHALFGLAVLISADSLSGFAAEPSMAPGAIAYLNSFQGNCEVRSKGSIVEPLKAGTPLFTGDTIQTANDGKAEIYVYQSGLISLQSNSHLLLSSREASKNTVPERLFRLLRGQARGVFDKLNAPLSLENPGAVAGIRGTRLVWDENQFSLLEGEVEVVRTQGSGRLTLYSGDSASTAARQNFAIVPIPLNRLQGLDEAFDLPPQFSQTPFVISHHQWAAMVVRALNYQMPKGWDAYPLSRYLELLSPIENNPVTLENESAPSVEQEIAVPLTGAFKLSAKLVGPPQYWSFDGLPTVLSPGSQALAQFEVGPFDLQRGVQRLAITIPKGGRLTSFQMVGPAFAGFAPKEGWQKDRVLRYGEMATILAKILEVGESTSEREDPQAYQTLADKLKHRGFLFREADQPVFGTDGVENAARLRGDQLPEVNKAKKSKKAKDFRRVDEGRSSVSPVLPAESQSK